MIIAILKQNHFSKAKWPCHTQRQVPLSCRICLKSYISKIFITCMRKQKPRYIIYAIVCTEDTRQCLFDLTFSGQSLAILPHNYEDPQSLVLEAGSRTPINMADASRPLTCLSVPPILPLRRLFSPRPLPPFFFWGGRGMRGWGGCGCAGGRLPFLIACHMKSS